MNTNIKIILKITKSTIHRLQDGLFEQVLKQLFTKLRINISLVLR